MVIRQIITNLIALFVSQVHGNDENENSLSGSVNSQFRRNDMFIELIR